ncbi:alpha-glucosidase protein [Halorhabdus tiamatea SARL4B]|uniref:Alpha-glucosidase protein n=1 Tax=Halorhabdus tiamatea SARL4B TaxID=1033806 RepID=F7PLF2_9EURY|nr:alpha-glucosidase [Halorhabdus tiamatea]ERJ04795.1 alpha-glucosidase protein [Halorhabdus tiamatea SARL4B]CCQ33066.1 oligo-1,6-glucosidase, family GH13 [Halorhabdus tiamatea SARL4B]
MNTEDSPGASVRTTNERIDREWWKEAVVYQIYPKSFSDSDGDGIGDIPGIVEKVDYLDELGVDAVWLSPVYQSPQADNGYDISDYRAIDDQYGSMADFDELLSALHDRDIRLVMDLVVNHTSDEHEWFKRSRRGEEPYDEYYYWREGDPETPPNNWESIFGGSAWSYDDEREAWYLHLFHEKQPDLNWRNPAVREAVYDMVNWWLEKGIDGFRLDAVNLLSKAEGLPDGDPAKGITGREHFFNGPAIHTYLGELHDRTVDRYDAMTVAEMGGITHEHALAYCGEDGDGIDMVFQFLRDELGGEDDPAWEPLEWTLPELTSIVTDWQTGLAGEAWVAPVLENHDQPRSVSWWGSEAARRESATMLATFLLTMRGTPFVYQGQELGMTNTDFESLEELGDPATKHRVENAIANGDVESFADAKRVINLTSRDHARTPMQWSADANAGFTDGEPWLKVNENYPEINAAAQRGDPDSVRAYYQELIALRHDAEVLVYGDFEMHCPDHESVLAYTRTLGDDRALVVLNWSDDPTTIDVPPGVPVDEFGLTLANRTDVPTTLDERLALEPWDGRVYLT